MSQIPDALFLQELCDIPHAFSRKKYEEQRAQFRREIYCISFNTLTRRLYINMHAEVIHIYQNMCV